MDNVLAMLTIISHVEWPAAFAFLALCAAVAVPRIVRRARDNMLKLAQIEADKTIKVAEINTSVRNGAVALRDQ